MGDCNPTSSLIGGDDVLFSMGKENPPVVLSLNGRPEEANTRRWCWPRFVGKRLLSAKILWELGITSCLCSQSFAAELFSKELGIFVLRFRVSLDL